MKYKVGDRVIILPRATRIGVLSSHVGRVGTVSKIIGLDNYYVKVEKGPDCAPYRWNVWEEYIKPHIEVGQQLLFSFMEE